LTFRNAAVDAKVADAPQEIVVTWLQFNNATGAATPLGMTTAHGTSMSAPVPPNLPSAPGTYIRAEIAAKGGPESWAQPLHVYFFREAGAWKLVGYERVPGGNPPNSEGESSLQSSVLIRTGPRGQQ
jgi:hypothetical protein